MEEFLQRMSDHYNPPSHRLPIIRLGKHPHTGGRVLSYITIYYENGKVLIIDPKGEMVWAG
jgi:hypothetical protein